MRAIARSSAVARASAIARSSAVALTLGLLHVVGAARAQRFGLDTAAGEALRLVRYDVEVVIAHPVAATTVTQEFENPQAVNVETFFHYPVPLGATVHGLALWVNGERREARMLERQRAREIYDGIVRQKRDPALLERLDGNVFRIRIFPVLPRSRTRVELRFAQPVEQDGRGRYRYTLRRPPGETQHALRLGVRLTAPFAIAHAALEGYAALGRSGQAGAPSPGQLAPAAAGALVFPRPYAGRGFLADIHLRYATRQPPLGALAAAATRDGRRQFVAELPLADGDPAPRRMALLLDASATMRPHLPRLRALGRALLDRLGARDQLAVAGFDLLPRRPLALRTLDVAGRQVALRALDELEARGGTAFVPAVRAAAAAGARQVVLVTDGGSRFHGAELEHLLRVLVDDGALQLAVVATPGSTNEEPLHDLAAASGGLYQRLEPGADLDALAARLAAPAAPAVTLHGAGGALHVLRREPGRLLVAGSVPVAEAPRAALWTASGERLPLVLAAADAAGVDALVGGAAIDALLRRIKLLGEEEELRPEVVRLSQRHNVVSEYTALLATETDADYNRPTSGQKWQRQPATAGDDLPPTFQSTPEPHEWALILLALGMLVVARRRGWLARRAVVGPPAAS